MSKDIIGGDSFVKKIEPEIKSQTRFFYALAPDDASASPL